ncbi:hypothetical protein M9H77_16667 [Catharanthus roseus]|uniref:Uncharacterized protein n=1 Tax=Catharanthus roseus TaxID=4058 RepID=A0ACC0B2E7_CATRO|nr:hypothetical protein M9H77_16667 [Catharanthus roseus]
MDPLFVVVSLDAILIDSKTFEDHLHNLEQFCIENVTLLGYALSFQGCQVGATKVQEIQDWLISKSAFEEESFHGFTILYKEFNKDLGILDSIFLDLPKEKTGFPSQLCLLIVEIASNQAYHSPILYSSFEVDYGDNLLMSFDLTLLSIDHALRFGEVLKMEFGQERPSKLFTIYSIVKDQSREQLGKKIG